MREKAVALAVMGVMRTKTNLGLGMKRKKKITFRKIVYAAKRTMPKRGVTVMTAITSPLKGAREAVREAGGRSLIRSPRILPVPTKVEGVFPAFLIPLFAVLTAAGRGAAIARGCRAPKRPMKLWMRVDVITKPWNKWLSGEVSTSSLSKEDWDCVFQKTSKPATPSTHEYRYQALCQNDEHCQFSGSLYA